MSTSPIKFPTGQTQSQPGISAGIILAESGISTLLILGIIIIIVAAGAVVFFIKKKYDFQFLKFGLPAAIIGICVVIAVIIIFIVCWYRGKKAKNCATLYGNNSNIPIGPASVVVNNYHVISNFVEERVPIVSSIYVNDLMGIQLISPSVAAVNLVDPAFTMGNYYGKTIVIGNNTVDLSTITDINIIFNHNGVQYQSKALILAMPSNNSIIFKIPTFGYQ